MSFYEENDDSDSNSNHGDSSHHCPICGGKDFHKFDGVLTCSTCFTQSQTQVLEEVVDDDDFERIIGGREKIRRVRQVSLNRKKPMSYYDHRKPLPTVDDCVLAAQYLLKMMARRLSLLAGVDEKDVLKEVRSLWFGYLKGWMEGAEVYSELLKQEEKINLPRFSLRDAFLGEARTSYLISFLERKIKQRMDLCKVNPHHEEIENLKKENFFDSSDDSGNNESTKKSDSSSTSSYSSDSESSASSENSLSGYAEDIAIKPVKKINRNTNFQLKKLSTPSVRLALDKTTDSLGRNTISRYEAALRSPPSMVLFVSILHRALFNLRAGVASAHLRLWIMNGSFPYIAAYDSLSPSMQKRVQSISQFFRPLEIPSAASIDYFSELVWIASGRDPLLKLDESEREQLAVRHKTSMIDNAPLMTARFIKDLGFNKRVLDLSYALMGIETSIETADRKKESKVTKKNFTQKKKRKYIGNEETKENETKDESDKDQSIHRKDTTEDDSTENYEDQSTNDNEKYTNEYTSSWLPPPLQFAKLDHISSPVDILAVIIVACKMCPDWETWTYKHPTLMHTKKEKKQPLPAETAKIEGKMIRSENHEPFLTSTLNNEKITQRPLLTNSYIPYHETRLQYVTNGVTLENFSNFAAKIMYARHEANPKFQNIVTWLEKEHKKKQVFKPTDSSITSNTTPRPNVLPNPIIARPIPPAIPDPKQQLSPEQINKIVEKYAFPYPNKLSKIPHYKISHGSKLARWSTRVTTSRLPMHPAQGLLIEYICDKFDMDPSFVFHTLEKLETEVSEMGKCLFSSSNTKQYESTYTYQRRRLLNQQTKNGRFKNYEKWKMFKVHQYHTRRSLGTEEDRKMRREQSLKHRKRKKESLSSSLQTDSGSSEEED